MASITKFVGEQHQGVLQSLLVFRIVDFDITSAEAGTHQVDDVWTYSMSLSSFWRVTVFPCLYSVDPTQHRGGGERLFSLAVQFTKWVLKNRNADLKTPVPFSSSCLCLCRDKNKFTSLLMCRCIRWMAVCRRLFDVFQCIFLPRWTRHEAKQQRVFSITARFWCLVSVSLPLDSYH